MVVLHVHLLDYMVVDIKTKLVVFQLSNNCQLAIGDSKWCHLIEDGFILTILGAVFISSSTVAILEPCLPYWLIENFSLEVSTR